MRNRNTANKGDKEGQKSTVKALLKSLDKPLFIAIAGAFIIGLLIGFAIAPATAQTVYKGASPAQAAENLKNWLEAYFKNRGLNVSTSINSVKEESGIYVVEMTLSFNGQNQPVKYFVSKDGRYFFPQAINITNIPKVEFEVPKKDKPTVELFVMSHCPFGVQMEKALIPVLKLLGNKVDFKLRFVNYAMHGEDEVWENVRQYCIQKEYGTEKLLDYLQCLDYSGKQASNDCMKSVGIEANKIEQCISRADKEYNISKILSNRALWYGGRFPPFPIDDALNQKYGVRGSPTLVINGTVVRNAQRNPEALKNLICSSFTTPPQECEQNLSTETPSPGFGGGTGRDTAAQCG